MNTSKSRWVNFTFLIIVNVLWAAQYPAYKIAGDQMEAGALNFWTFVFACALLVPFLLRQKRREPGSTTHWGRRAIIGFVLMGLLGIVPPSVLLAWGIAHSSASNGAILSLTIPLLMTVMGALLLGERITRLRILTLGLGLAGTVLVSINDVRGASFSRSLLAGNFAIFLGAAGSAFYNAYGKSLLERFSEIEVLVWSYVSGGFFCALISAIWEAKPVYSVSGYSVRVWIAVAVLGFLSWGIAMVLWMWVLNRLDVGQISVSIYLLPFFGLLFSVLTVHERLRPLQLVGGAIVVIATAVLTSLEKPQISHPEASLPL
ncbi:MAG TPA: DMT family transporter [Bryobacteraceae bacterium]|jgi:drug/metabolite transporter (DMT)-like permease|nr:DMT family transporter [Bryobacteraceae bacterium]